MPGYNFRFNGPGNNLIAIYAAAVVPDFNHHLIALVISLKRKRAIFRFAERNAFSRRLNAVVDGIAQDMGERLSHRVEDAFIEVGVFSADFKTDLASAGLGHVTHQTWEPAEELLHRDHADFHDGLLQLVQHS